LVVTLLFLFVIGGFSICCMMFRAINLIYGWDEVENKNRKVFALSVAAVVSTTSMIMYTVTYFMGEPNLLYLVAMLLVTFVTFVNILRSKLVTVSLETVAV